MRTLEKCRNILGISRSSWNVWTCIRRYKLLPPLPSPRKYLQGLLPRFRFIGLALTHIPKWKEGQMQSSSTVLVQWKKPAHRRKRRSPNADWIEIVWEARPVLDAKRGPTWVCFGPPLARLYDSHNTNVSCLSGCEMTRFCYMRRSIIHYVQDHEWLRNTLALIRGFKMLTVSSFISFAVFWPHLIKFVD